MKIFQLIFLFLCLSSCASLDKYTVARINDLSKKPFETGKKYVFANFPIGNFNTGEFVVNDSTGKDNYTTIWSYIEPKYIKKDSLLYRFKTSIELKNNNKIHYRLIDSLGNTKREITKKYTRGKNYILYSFSEHDFYFIINRLNFDKVYLYLDNENNLYLTNKGAI